jgi:hypothetical protein
MKHKGRKLGPYFVRRWKENGKLHKQYIKPGDVEKIRARCEAYREERRRQHQMLDDFNTFKGNWNYYFRILKRLQKRNVEPEHHTHMRAIAVGDFFLPGRPNLRVRRRFMVPSLSNRPFRFNKKWKEMFETNFWKGYNETKPPLTPEEKFEAQAKDLRDHILATVKPKKRRLALIAAAENR